MTLSLTPLTTTPVSDLWLAPPPMWLVSNGEVTVGPVRTDLLVRGVLFGRVPDHCLVREVGWDRWRPLDQIREVNALRERTNPSPADAPRWRWPEVRTGLELAGDPGEVLLVTLHLAAQATSAVSGLIHRLRGPFRLPVASYSFGETHHSLGELVLSSDPVFARARRGGDAIGAADSGPVERSMARRLGRSRPVTSVLMVPLVTAAGLCGWIELGRADRAFRRSDREELRALARRAGTLISILEDKKTTAWCEGCTPNRWEFREAATEAEGGAPRAPPAITHISTHRANRLAIRVQ